MKYYLKLVAISIIEAVILACLLLWATSSPAAPKTDYYRITEKRTSNVQLLKQQTFKLTRIYCLPDSQCAFCVKLKRSLKDKGIKLVPTKSEHPVQNFYPLAYYHNGAMPYMDNGEFYYGGKCSVAHEVEVVTVENPE